MFLPTTIEEVREKGWDKLDIILVTGDAYIDSPHIGVSVIGHALLDAGYKVGIIGQPDVSGGSDITCLGEPALFWGVTGGCVDSMVANYTATKKKRNSDDFTPGGFNYRRPARAVIAYCNLIKKHYKPNKPIVLGGVEVSLRRTAHYDYWDDDIRRSILFDTRADYIVYGMGESASLELAEAFRDGKDAAEIRGICYISPEPKDGYKILPSYDEVKSDKTKFAEAFKAFYDNNDPSTSSGLCQKQDTRYLIQNPPAPYLEGKDLDRIFEFDYERAVHPYYAEKGAVKAIETIKYSITSHLGCFGECNFCSIAVHQGSKVRSRTEASILKEAEKIAKLPGFNGIIYDVGGATANMYGMECRKGIKCRGKRCAFPVVCASLNISHKRQIELLRKLMRVPGVKKVFIGSGVRHDLIMLDKESGREYMYEIIENHISGQLKIAPEHTDSGVLNHMGKPGGHLLLDFKKEFDRINLERGKKQFLTYYFIAAHPGCTGENMAEMKKFISKELKMRPEQVQVFTPTPSTYSALMYYTGLDPFTEKELFVEKDLRGKERQKQIIASEFHKDIRQQRKMGRDGFRSRSGGASAGAAGWQKEHGHSHSPSGYRSSHGVGGGGRSKFGGSRPSRPTRKP
ncbi:MAG: YgiQ family radical SAM protein [Elusimicrobiota bacterium]